MLKNLLNIIASLEITPTQIKVFLFAFLAMTIMVGLQRLGIHSPLGLFSLDK
jgi:hypothetical protein